MGDYDFGLNYLFKGLIIAGVAGTVLAGTAAYFGGRHSANKREVMKEMIWLADHNAVYGNKNGQLDLEEKLGVIKDLKAHYKADQTISFEDAKKYISLYNNSTISIDK